MNIETGISCSQRENGAPDLKKKRGFSPLMIPLFPVRNNYYHHSASAVPRLDGQAAPAHHFKQTETKQTEAPQPQTEAPQTQTVAAPAPLVETITIPKTPAKIKTKAKKNKITVSWKKIKKSKKTNGLDFCYTQFGLASLPVGVKNLGWRAGIRALEHMLLGG